MEEEGMVMVAIPHGEGMVMVAIPHGEGMVMVAIPHGKRRNGDGGYVS